MLESINHSNHPVLRQESRLSVHRKVKPSVLRSLLFLFELKIHHSLVLSNIFENRLTPSLECSFLVLERSLYGAVCYLKSLESFCLTSKKESPIWLFGGCALQCIQDGTYALFTVGFFFCAIYREVTPTSKNGNVSLYKKG